jgi:FSR family fosmidomycin resistance protein-like MFS transporter
VLSVLVIELLDELAGGIREAAWPSIRQDLGLSYLQIGFLLGLPAILSGFIDPLTGIMADLGRRKGLVIAGGVFFALSLVLTAASPGFWLLLLSFVVFYPASGAFVNIAQAELMDRIPARRDQNMARWTLAGSAGALIGPAVLGAASGIGVTWRWLYVAVGLVSGAALAFAARAAFPRRRARSARASRPPRRRRAFSHSLRGMAGALRNLDVLRWLVLLELANLMLDVLFGFLALYFVEVASVTPAQAALAVTVWAATGVIGDLVLIPLLERVSGTRYLRLSAALVLAAYPCFLVTGPLVLKLALVGLIGLLRAGWYAILQARLYAALPGRSGVAVAVSNLASSAGALIPVALGALAQAVGLRAAMWALLAAPLALVIGLPRRREGDGTGRTGSAGDLADDLQAGVFLGTVRDSLVNCIIDERSRKCVPETICTCAAGQKR